MHKHVRSNYQNPSQKFWQKHKNIKFPKKKKKKNLENLGLHAWNTWRKKKRRDQEHLPSEGSLD